LAVERYAVDHPQSSYPRQIKEVIKLGYLEEFPLNPFTGLPMRCVEESSSADYKFDYQSVPVGAEFGDFLYYKRYGKDGQQNPYEAPMGYSLAAYM
jgi:hypothetical protein